MLQPLVAHEKARAGELGVLVVGPQHVADILAHKALDATLRLVEALHVLLVHRERRLLLAVERLDGAGSFVVPRDVRDQVLYDRERLHRVNPDLLILELLHAGLAQKTGLAVDLRAARTAVGGLAVPANTRGPAPGAPGCRAPRRARPCLRRGPSSYSTNSPPPESPRKILSFAVLPLWPRSSSFTGACAIEVTLPLLPFPLSLKPWPPLPGTAGRGDRASA